MDDWHFNNYRNKWLKVTQPSFGEIFIEIDNITTIIPQTDTTCVIYFISLQMKDEYSFGKAKGFVVSHNAEYVWKLIESRNDK